VLWAERVLDAMRMDGRPIDAGVRNPTTHIINRILDITAAMTVMRIAIPLIEGNWSADSQTILNRAEAAVTRFTGGYGFRHL
jgi:hypothetical protein